MAFSDAINPVAQAIENVVALGIIVVIRTFLSFSLQVEIDETLPWRARSDRKEP